MLATTNRYRCTVVVSLILLCCCCSAKDETDTRSRDDQVRTKSSSSPRQKQTQSLTVGKPAVVDGNGGAVSPSRGSKKPIRGRVSDDKQGKIKNTKNTKNVGVFHDYLFRRPTKIVRNLMKSGMYVVQRGMNAFESVSSNVFRIAHENIGGRAPVQSSETGDKKHRKKSRSADNKQPKPGFVRGLGQSVFNIIDTGISGVEQVTDFSLLLGNMGTQKLLSMLDGKNGNKEIMNLLIKYIASRVGMTTKGDATQLLDDVGTISTFIAKDDNVSNTISMLMEKFMANRDVRIAMVRMAITVMESSPSTSCLLDRLPLKPKDVRMMFDVFVGSSGQIMLQTIAGLVSELTTGPDTKAFLESALGMVSMFKSDGPALSKSEKPKSMMSSLTDFFTGGGEEDEEEEPVAPQPPVVKKKKKIRNRNNRNNRNNGGKPASKPNPKKLTRDEDDMKWFNDDSDKPTSKPSPKIPFQDEDDMKWFNDDGDKPTSKPNSKKPFQDDDDMNWFNDDGGDSFGVKDSKPAKVNRANRRNVGDNSAVSRMVDSQERELKPKNKSQKRVPRKSADVSEFDRDTSNSKSRRLIKNKKNREQSKSSTNADGEFSDDDRTVVKNEKRLKNIKNVETGTTITPNRKLTD